MVPVALRSEANQGGASRAGTGQRSAGQHGASQDGDAPDPRRWLILGVIGIAQLMVVLDGTVMNIALPSAQHALHFSTVDRQWVVTAYTLRVRQPAVARRQAFRPVRPESDVPDRADRLRGRLGHRRRVDKLRDAGDRACLPGRVRGDPGAVRAVGADHHVHPAGRARQGLRRLRRDRGGGGSGRPAARRRADLLPVLALGAVHQPRLRRRCLRGRHGADAPAAPADRPRLDIPGVLPVSGGMFFLVYGFSNAGTPTGTPPRPTGSSPPAWRRSARSRTG